MASPVLAAISFMLTSPSPLMMVIAVGNVGLLDSQGSSSWAWGGQSLGDSEVKKRIRRQEGSVARIDLGVGYGSALAVVLTSPSFAIFDERGRDPNELGWLASAAPMFFVAVDNYAITRGHWPIVEKGPVDTSRLPIPPKFMQNRQMPEKIQIYQNGSFRPSTREEVEGLALEALAVWSPEQVEDRVRDAYAGRENKWLSQLKLI